MASFECWQEAEQPPAKMLEFGLQPATDKRKREPDKTPFSSPISSLFTQREKHVCPNRRTLPLGHDIDRPIRYEND
jgi:hypothetical protein